MKKRTFVIVTILLLAVKSMSGQIIFTEEDQSINRTVGEGFGVMVPMQNTNLDQYTQSVVPLGDAWLLLVGLGGAYLIRSSRLKGRSSSRHKKPSR